MLKPLVNGNGDNTLGRSSREEDLVGDSCERRTGELDSELDTDPGPVDAFFLIDSGSTGPVCCDTMDSGRGVTSLAAVGKKGMRELRVRPLKSCGS